MYKVYVGDKNLNYPSSRSVLPNPSLSSFSDMPWAAESSRRSLVAWRVPVPLTSESEEGSGMGR